MVTRHPSRSRAMRVTAASVFALSAALAFSAPPSKAVPEPALYVVGYSHLDTEWCWSYPQVIREFIPNTLHDNFKLFEKYPEYIFNWTGSNRYRFMKEYYPEDYAKLKKYIAAGRWFPAGSSVEEGDVNSPSEESLLRQFMYGNQFFRREFGKASSEYMLPDCFGFPASLPSLLAHAGLKGFSTQKLTWGSAVGIPFNVGKWVGPDGQSIIAALNATSYGSNIDGDLSNSDFWLKRVQGNPVPVDYRYYGTGDRGGSPEESSVANLEKSLKSGGPLHLFAGRADQLFNDLTPAQTAKLPSYKGDLELTMHSAGSLTSETAMKRWNRKNELLADETERASVVADWLGALPYDRSRITDAWLRFLPGQFHDLMAGTCLPVAYNYTWNDEVLAMNEFAGVLQASVGGVARALDTRTKGVPVVVYNPLSIAREDVAEATLHYSNSKPKGVRVYGPDGLEVPSQIVERKDGELKLLFLARAGSVGFTVYDVRSSASSAVRSPELTVSGNSLENALYRVSLDSNGDVSHVYDKRAHKELLSKPARLVYMYENPREYPAWNMDWSDQSQAPRTYVKGPATVKIVENGPVRVALQVTREFEGSRFVQTIRLASGHAGNRVEFKTDIDWKGKQSALKAEFPLTVSNPKATYNWELGTIQRGNNDPKKYEVASHKWFDLTDKSGAYGVSVLDDCKYGSDKPSDDTVRLTLIYTPGVRGGFEHQACQDWGHNEMLYALEGHSGDWRQGKTQWEATRLNQPLIAFQTTAHAGKLARDFSLVQVSDPNVSIEAMKKAEDSDEVIIRLNELAGKSARNVRISFAAPVVSAREVNGQELPVGSAKIDRGALVVDTTAYHPRAFALRLAKAPVQLAAAKSTALALPYNLDAVSSWAHKTEGNFDGHGRSIPGELLPSTIVSDGVTFKLGPVADGKKNAVICSGQRLNLPKGKNRRFYFLAASADGDTNSTFQTILPRGSGRNDWWVFQIPIQSWKGYIGQWDNRLWGGEVPELTYGWSNPLTGLVPGYIKRDTVAWYADHFRTEKGENALYEFCYLYRYSFQVPDSATFITLPKDEKVRIFAATVAENPNDDTAAAQPLYDTLENRQNTAPTISPVAGKFKDSTAVSIEKPLYWKPSDTLRYTFDGTTPSAQSAVYEKPILLRSVTALKVALVDESGKAGKVSSAHLDVNDVTPPSLVEATSIRDSHFVHVKFSEPVELSSATDVSHYQFGPNMTVTSVALNRDGTSVDLQIATPLPTDTSYDLQITGVRDLSGNPTDGATHAVTPIVPVANLDTVFTLSGARRSTIARENKALPVNADQPWTINMFVFLDHQPLERTNLAGFGGARDDSGSERYLANFENGIHFWGGSVDLDAGEAFDLNRWQMITLTFDGTNVSIFKDGRELKSAPASFSAAEPVIKLAPRGPWNDHIFAGKIANMTIWPACLPEESIRGLLGTAPK